MNPDESIHDPCRGRRCKSPGRHGLILESGLCACQRLRGYAEAMSDESGSLAERKPTAPAAPTAFLDLCHERDVRWPRRTERLVITEFTAQDLDEVWSYWRLPETTQWTSRRYEQPDQLLHRWETGRSKLVLRTHAGDVVGDLGARIQNAWAQEEVLPAARNTQAEVDWALAPAHQGRGYASEAVCALLDLLLTELGIRRIEAGCFAENTRSWKLMESLGMRRELHSVRESLHRDLGWMDGLLYGLLADEWSSRRGR